MKHTYNPDLVTGGLASQDDRRRAYYRDKARRRRANPQLRERDNAAKREKRRQYMHDYRVRKGSVNDQSVEHTKLWRAEEDRILTLPVEERLDILNRMVYNTCQVRLDLPTVPLEGV